MKAASSARGFFGETPVGAPRLPPLLLLRHRHMLIRKRPYLVLWRHCNRTPPTTRPHNGDFADLPGDMVTGLDRREYRETVVW